MRIANHVNPVHSAIVLVPQVANPAAPVHSQVPDRLHVFLVTLDTLQRRPSRYIVPHVLLVHMQILGEAEHVHCVQKVLIHRRMEHMLFLSASHVLLEAQLWNLVLNLHPNVNFVLLDTPPMLPKIHMAVLFAVLVLITT